jgi:hypothetical protein
MVSDSKLRRERSAPKTSRRYFDEQTKREAIEALLKGEKHEPSCAKSWTSSRHSCWHGWDSTVSAYAPIRPSRTTLRPLLRPGSSASCWRSRTNSTLQCCLWRGAYGPAAF